MKNKNQMLIVGMVVILFLSSSIAVGQNNSTIGTNCFNDINLELSFIKPTVEKIEINDELFDRITINNLPNSNDLLKPRLPVKPVKILIPYGRELDYVDAVVKDQTFLGTGYDIEVGRNIIPLKDTPAQKDTIDQNDVSSEDIIYSIIGTNTFRGYDILFVNLHPVHYDEETGELFYYKQIDLKIITKESVNIGQIRGLQKDEDIVIQMVDNPSCIDSYENAYETVGRDTVEYIIITDEDLSDSTEEYTFQDLIQSKIDKGMTAEIYTVEDIVDNPEYWVMGTWGDGNPSNPYYESEIVGNYEMFNDTQAKIRNFIRYAHSTLATDYILLGGDADEVGGDNIIPLRGLYACEEGLPLDMGTLDFEEDDIPSDVYYACLNGNFNYDNDESWGENATNNDIADVDEADLIAEIYVGRACADADIEVSNFVFKTLSYDASDDDPYLIKGLMIGEYLGFPGISAYGGNYKDLIIPIITDDYNVETLYERDTNWNKYDLIEIINTATPHFMNHLGHGNHDYALKMHNSDILTLTNEKYFFVYSQTCLAGSFDNWNPWNGYLEEDSAAEHFTVETPHGAFAVIFNARYGLGSENTLYSPSQILDESFFHALFTEDIRQLGPANHYSKEDHIWHINENGIRWVFYETNLFGDPEIAIKDPTSSNVELEVEIVKPEDDGILYLFNGAGFKIPFLQMPFIIGKITVQAEASSEPEGEVFSVEFFIDNESQLVDYEEPYEFEINTQTFGKHTITAEVHGLHGETESKSIEVKTLIFGI